MATDILPSTTGVLGLWDGTKDGEDGYVGTRETGNPQQKPYTDQLTILPLYPDYATGITNLNRPKEYEIKVHDIRKIEPKVSVLVLKVPDNCGYSCQISHLHNSRAHVNPIH
jgi:hypothetical protein